MSVEEHDDMIPLLKKVSKLFLYVEIFDNFPLNNEVQNTVLKIDEKAVL